MTAMQKVRRLVIRKGAQVLVSGRRATVKRDAPGELLGSSEGIFTVKLDSGPTVEASALACYREED